MKMMSSILDSRMRRALICALLGVAFYLTSFYANAAPLLTADTITYDEESNSVTAIGNVELSAKDHILHADQVIYNRTTDIAKALGNIALLSQKTGEIMYAKELELTSDMREFLLSEIGILFPDQSRIVAADAQRFEGRYLVANRTVYTACHLCAKDPTKPPIWQVRAARATHDNVKKNIVYRDAIIDFWGVPVFYTPYFSHPDPTVSRRQGFLTPSAGLNTTIGPMMRTPYYYDLAPNSDLTITPTISTKDILQTAVAWRHKFSRGKINLEGSVAYAEYVDDNNVDQGKQWRGHIFGKAIFNLTDTWRVGSNIAYTSDKGYMNRYDIAGDDLLVNRFYAERFKGRNYFVSDIYYFQDMRPGTLLTEPLVMPEIRYSALGEPGAAWGGRWSFDTSLLVTEREDQDDPEKLGPSTRRLSLEGGWERQFVSDTGFLTTLGAQARADTYYADNVSDGQITEDVSAFRPYSQADVQVRYPLGRQGKGYEQLLEPIAVLSLAPRVNNDRRLPNEDSLDIEFDETNLFSSNRFTGIDRVESGTRAAYGLRHAIYGHHGERLEMLAGQVFRFQADDTFTLGSGLRDNFSDFVGHIDLSYSKWLNFSYGFRLDQRDLGATRQEVEATGGIPLFTPSVKFLSLKQSEGSSTVDERIEEATVGFTSKFSKYWSVSAEHKRAMSPNPGPRKTALLLSYQDECFRTELSLRRDYTDQVDVEKGTTFMFNIYLRNFGDSES